MSAQNDQPDSISQGALAPPYDQALQLGLKPYAEFEKKMSPLFKRINSKERDGYLRNIYRLAAEKVLMDTGKTEAENNARQLAEEAEMVRSAVRDIEAAWQSLSRAAGVFPQEFSGRLEIERIASQLQDIMRRLAEKERDLARYADVLRNLKGADIAVRSASPSTLQYEVRLQNMDEVAPDLPSGEQSLESYIRSLAGPGATVPYRYFHPSGGQLTATDRWLISKINGSLPEAPPGMRLRFSRDKIISTTFEAALGDPMRTSEGVRSVRRPRKGKSNR